MKKNLFGLRPIIFIFAFIYAVKAFSIPLKYEFKDDGKEKSVSILAIEIIPSKVSEKILSSKNAHGKTVIRKIPVEPMDISKKGEVSTSQYLVKVKNIVIDANKTTQFKKNIVKKSVLKSKPIKEDPIVMVMVKIQIQKNGHYDVLSISSIHSINQKLVEVNMQKIEKFPQIPDSIVDNLELDELQIIMTMKLHKLN